MFRCISSLGIGKKIFSCLCLTYKLLSFLDSRWLHGVNKRERCYISTSCRTKKTDRYGKFHTALKILVVIAMFVFRFPENVFLRHFPARRGRSVGKLFVIFVWLVSTSWNRTQNHNFSRALSPVNVFASSHSITTFRIFTFKGNLYFTLISPTVGGAVSRKDFHRMPKLLQQRFLIYLWNSKRTKGIFFSPVSTEFRCRLCNIVPRVSGASEGVIR